MLFSFSLFRCYIYIYTRYSYSLYSTYVCIWVYVVDRVAESGGHGSRGAARRGTVARERVDEERDAEGDGGGTNVDADSRGKRVDKGQTGEGRGSGWQGRR